MNRRQKLPNSMADLDYWFPQSFKFYSPQYCHELYFICRMEKIFHQYFLNNTGIKFTNQLWLGSKVIHPPQKSSFYHNWSCFIQHNSERNQKGKVPITFKSYMNKITKVKVLLWWISVNRNSLLEWLWCPKIWLKNLYRVMSSSETQHEPIIAQTYIS